MDINTSPSQTFGSAFGAPDLRSRLAVKGDPLDELLLKNPRDWTEEEATQVQKAVSGMSSSDPRRTKADAMVWAWYDHYYGTDPVAKDETGRPLQPQFKTQPPRTPVAAPGGPGQSQDSGLTYVGDKLSALAAKTSEPQAVSALQNGLNRLSPAAILKVDGDLGPKTLAVIKDTLAQHGPGKVMEGLALSHFENGMKQGETATPEELEKLSDESFADLYPSASGKTKAWGQAVQDAINQLGVEVQGRDAWTPLVDDGWLGPKSKDAFDTVLKAVGPRRFVEALGRSMGFLQD